MPDLSFMGDHSVPSIGRDGKTESVELPKVQFFAAGFVCKSRSKLNAQAFALMSARGGCLRPYVSLDAAWCFDFGVASRVDATGRSKKLFYC